MPESLPPGTEVTALLSGIVLMSYEDGHGNSYSTVRLTMGHPLDSSGTVIVVADENLIALFEINKEIQ